MENEYTIKSIDGKLSFEEYKKLVESFINTAGLSFEESNEKGAKK